MTRRKHRPHAPVMTRTKEVDVSRYELQKQCVLCGRWLGLKHYSPGTGCMGRMNQCKPCRRDERRI